MFTFGSLHLYFRFHIPLALHIIMNISHLLLVVNSSINFIIYCCVAKRFRKEVKILLALICQKCFKRHETQVMETQLTGLGSQRGSQRSRWEKIDTTLCAQIFIFVPKNYYDQWCNNKNISTYLLLILPSGHQIGACLLNVAFSTIYLYVLSMYLLIVKISRKVHQYISSFKINSTIAMYFPQ